MQFEFDTLIRNKTCNLVPRPGDANTIRYMWIFRHKKKIDTSFKSYKARIADDIILITFTHALRKSIMSLLTFEFAMKDLGPLSYFLGIVIYRHPSGLFLSHSTYASEIIEHAGMASCKPSATLVDTKQKLSTSSGTPYEDHSLYQSLAKALQYLPFTLPFRSPLVRNKFGSRLPFYRIYIEELVTQCIINFVVMRGKESHFASNKIPINPN
ncbi:uncharacterized mitochondrial protein AtMg00810-like [Lathyrus oleraceus]|uniref:uncharacterized mitochondrial protein AtMg00810-like n=1 Tax=Pisum sativum TaxID=3888 RepID=UPI0021CFC69F|nr:uncharacterized mitochondrial protein AtMg00810-like [Pisum sativum]